MKSVLAAFQFLTILPVRVSSPLTEAEVARSSSAFVVVGFAQGLLIVAADFISGMAFHPDIVALIILIVLTLTNGGFHLDGLADTFDALAVRSSGNSEQDRENRLQVMKDSRTGSIGVVAIVFDLLLKYLLVKNIAHLIPFTYYSSLLLMPVLSKWTMVISMFHGRPGRREGLGSIFIGKIGLREVSFSTLLVLLLLLAFQLFFYPYLSEYHYLFYSSLLATGYLLCRLWISFCNRRFGGLTGDTVGAVSEFTDIMVLSMVLAWSRLSI